MQVQIKYSELKRFRVKKIGGVIFWFKKLSATKTFFNLGVKRSSHYDSF